MFSICSVVAKAAPRPLTATKEFSLQTEQRAKTANTSHAHVNDGAGQTRSRKRKESCSDQGGFKSMAEKIRDFTGKTPERYRRRPTNHG